MIDGKYVASYIYNKYFVYFSEKFLRMNSCSSSKKQDKIFLRLSGRTFLEIVSHKMVPVLLYKC